MAAIETTRVEESSVGTLSGDRGEDASRLLTLRGLACVLLVALHATSFRVADWRFDDFAFYRYFNELVIHLRMPLFAAISGFVYAYRPLAIGAGPRFLSRKLTRLGLPFVTASTLHFVLASRFASAAQKHDLPAMWQIYLFPYKHYWFLQALLLVFCVLVMLERSRLLSEPRKFAAVFALSLVPALLTSMEVTSPFSLNGAFYLMPFFLAGLGMHRFASRMLTRGVIRAALLAFIAAMLAHAVVVANAGGQVAHHGTPLGIILGLVGTFTLLVYVPSVALLSRIGKYSFSIFLYHTFFIAAAISVLNVTRLTSPHLALLVAAGAGMVGPALFDETLARSPFQAVRPLFLGRKTS